MSPQAIGAQVRRDVPLLRPDQSLRSAAAAVLKSGLPALPVVDPDGRLRGIFGEREFMTAMFPGYVSELGYAGFLTRRTDAVLAKRVGARDEPVGSHTNTEHIDVGPDFSDVHLAETFLHHRVLIIPVVEAGRLVGVITRTDFFQALVERVENLPDNET